MKSPNSDAGAGQQAHFMKKGSVRGFYTRGAAKQLRHPNLTRAGRTTDPGAARPNRRDA